jgi:hypothetical protein
MRQIVLKPILIRCIDRGLSRQRLHTHAKSIPVKIYAKLQEELPRSCKEFVARQGNQPGNREKVTAFKEKKSQERKGRLVIAAGKD